MQLRALTFEPVQSTLHALGGSGEITGGSIGQGGRADRAARWGQPQLRLGCSTSGTDCVIEVADDGRGIDWERVRAKAKEHGLPHTTREELVNALFADGLSTRDEASDTSGRGLGMSVVRFYEQFLRAVNLAKFDFTDTFSGYATRGDRRALRGTILGSHRHCR